MVTKDTVDEDIYKIQERKSKMNDAIMEKQKSKNESAEMCSLANAAIDSWRHQQAQPDKHLGLERVLLKFESNQLSHN